MDREGGNLGNQEGSKSEKRGRRKGEVREKRGYKGKEEKMR